MKKCALILGFIFLLKPVLPVLSYALNYQYIVENLCINREKPKLACQGKCHLAKEIAKEVESEQSTKESSKKEAKVFFESVFYLPSIATAADFLSVCQGQPKNFFRPASKPLLGYYNIIQPPPNV